MNASPPPTKPNPVVRVALWIWHAWLIYTGLFALIVLAVFLKDGKWWMVFPFAFIGFVVYTHFRIRRKR